MLPVVIILDPAPAPLPEIKSDPVNCCVSVFSSPNTFDPEWIIVDEDSNNCNTKLPVVADILVKPVTVVSSATVVPVTTMLSPARGATFVNCPPSPSKDPLK